MSLMIATNKLKRYTPEEYIKERNRLIRLGRARTKTFRDGGFNYYWVRLQTLDDLYPEFKGLGLIKEEGLK